MLYNIFRIYSRNIGARSRENAAYLSLKRSILRKPRKWKERWKLRKTYRFYKCPYCKADIRIRRPEAGAKIRIACPRCKKTFEKRV